MSIPKKEVTYRIPDYSKMTDGQLEANFERYIGKMHMLKPKFEVLGTKGSDITKELLSISINMHEITKETELRASRVDSFLDNSKN